MKLNDKPGNENTYSNMAVNAGTLLFGYGLALALCENKAEAAGNITFGFTSSVLVWRYVSGNDVKTSATKVATIAGVTLAGIIAADKLRLG